MNNDVNYYMSITIYFLLLANECENNNINFDLWFKMLSLENLIKIKMNLLFNSLTSARSNDSTDVIVYILTDKRSSM